LLVDPKIRNHWPGFRVTRPFRGAAYEIDVRNPKHVNRGVSSLRVDGKILPGNIISAYSNGRTHKVEVILGA